MKSSRIFRRKTDDFATADLMLPGETGSAESLFNTRSTDDHDEKGALGLNLLHAPSEPLIDIIFIHGLGGGSRRTWSLVPSIAQYYWPKEWLPKDAAFKNVRFHSFGYNSDYVKGRNNSLTIQNFGQSLLGDLRTSPFLGKGDTPLIMVGHSMGGLVMKRAYILAKHDPSLKFLATRFRAMYFLATPHQGSGWARVLDRMLSAFSLSREFVEELKKGSGALQAINEEFRHYFDQFELLSFYETQSMKHLGSRIVEPESGVLNLPLEKQIPMAADHRSICKFEKSTDPNYIALRNSLAMTVTSILDEQAKEKEVLRNRELSNLKSYLRLSHQPEDDLELVEGSRLSGTCEWIEKKERYCAWKDSAPEAPNILWISGKPATGKSVLAGYVIAQLLLQKSSCSYYFFKYGEKSKSRLVNCFKSLAFQMARGDDGIRHSLCDLHKEDAQLDGENERSIWRKIFVSKILRLLTTVHYWVIDGLDECEGSEAFIESLISQLDPTANLRILITARDMPKLKAAFLKLGSHRYCEMDVSSVDTVQDIETVIKAKSDSLTVKNDKIRTAILEKVLEKSRGSFLWTILVLEELANTYGEVELKKVLDEVPQDMNSLYQRVLDSMRLTTTEGGRKVAKAILKWVSCATRPLSTAELTGALNLDLGDKYDALEEMIPKLCGQLVALDKFGNVQIVHETVREYLTRDGLQSDFAVDKSQAHTRIAEICLQYLTGDEMRPSTTRKRGPRRNPITISADSRMKFSRYACAAFSHHLANANAESIDLLIPVSKFLESNVLSWIESVAHSKILTPIIRAAKDLRKYIKKCDVRPIGKEIQAIKASTTDLVRIVAKFRDALIADPGAIYNLIPPFCPSSTTLHKAGVRGRTTRLSINGLSYDHWDDRLTCIGLQDDDFTSIAYGDDLFAVGTASGTITIYHATSCEEHKTFNHGEPLRLLHFKPKSDVLVSCGLKKLTVWNSRTGDAIYKLQAPPRPIALHFDNKLLIVASRRNFLRSWDLKNNATLQVDRPWSHSDEDTEKPCRLQPCAISFSAGHQKMAVAYFGQPITIWDLEYDEYYGSCGKIHDNGETSRHLVTSLAFNPNPDIELLAASYLDGQLVLLDPFEGRELESFRANCRALTSSPNGRLLGGVAASETIHIYEFDTLRLLYRIKSSDIGIKQLAFSHDNLHFADIRRAQCNIWEPTMLLRDSVGDDRSESTSTSVIEATTSDDKVRISTMVLHKQGQVLICGKDDGSVSLYDARTGSFLKVLHRHKSQVRILSWPTGDSMAMSVDISNGIYASTLKVDSKGEWVPDKPPFQSRLDCGHAIVQLLHSETTKRLILSTRETDYLWDSDGNQIAARSYPKNPGIRLWLQHPQSQLHAICIEGAIAHVLSWVDCSQALSLRLAVDMKEMQLKSLRGYGSGRRQRVLLELSELNGPSRTRGLYLFDAALFDLERTNASRGTQPLEENRTVGIINQAAPETSPIPSTGHNNSLGDSVTEETIQAYQTHVAGPLFGPQLAALASHVSHVIHLSDDGNLIFLDSHSWVSSINLDDFEKCGTVSPAATERLSSLPIRYSRHFFVPYDWFSGTRDIVCAATKRDVLFARNGEVAVIKNGLDYAEEVTVDSSQVLRHGSQPRV